MQVLETAVYFFHQFNQLEMRDRLAVQFDAFRVILQMRRGVQPVLYPAAVNADAIKS